MNENKIDFTATPQFSFLYDTPPADFMSEYFDQFAIIEDIHRELEHTFVGFVVGFVTFAYLRINGTSTHNKLRIPANASFDTLSYDGKNNFFVEIFDRYKIICDANTVLHETASILEPYFMAGANKLSVEYQKNIAHDLPLLDWSDKGTANDLAAGMAGQERSLIGYTCDANWKERKLTNHAVGVYTEREQIREILVERTKDSSYSDLYRHVHHLAPLLNIKTDEKLLCSPILYNTYLINTLEQSGWPDNGCEKLIEKHLGNVTTVQTDSVLWAIQTLEVVLCGCNKQLILKADGLSAVHSKRNNGYDVIFLPEANCESIPDVGPLTVGNMVIEKQPREKGFESNNLYYVAFFYSLLNDNGRMLVQFDEKEELALSSENNYEKLYADKDKLLNFFVENNLIEAIIQTKNCTYMLIAKKRPETKHGKILFYYGQNFGYFIYGQFGQYDGNGVTPETLTSCIKSYSCETIQIKHDEGACIISSKEIKLNDYNLLPKTYIYDFNRVKRQTEFDLIAHIRHEANPRISDIEKSLKFIGEFLSREGLDDKLIQAKLDEDDVVPSVKRVIDGCCDDLKRLQTVFSVTREVVLESFDKSNFTPCDLNKLFKEISNYRGQKKFSIQVDGSVKSTPVINENAFRDMVDNIIRNAEIHGFTDDRSDYRVIFNLFQKGNKISITCINNGKPLPPNFTKEKLFAKGDKGVDSDGMGLGGERIGKILAAHDAGFYVLPDSKLPPGFTVGFKISLDVERESNEQR